MRRLSSRIAGPLGWAAAGGMGVAAFLMGMTWLARADSITPDLSALPAAVSAAQSSAAAAASSALGATASQTAAANSATAAQSAQSAAQSAVGSINTDFAGTFTVATLPSASANAGRRATVSDLGGDPYGQVRAVNGCWVRTGSPLNAKPQSIPVATTITPDGLATSSNILLTGSAMATKVTIAMTNACSMPGLVLSYPTGVFSATGTLAFAGLNANAPAVSVGGVGVTASFGVFALLPDGSNYQRTMGPTLP